MPRRYQQDSEGNTRRVWNGKFPEDFTPADTLLFMAETDRKLKEKEDVTMSDDKLLTPEEIAATERHFLMDAPIAELAEFRGVTVDEAVKLRTEAAVAAANPALKVTVRPIEPKGNLVAFASVVFNDSFVVDDFKVLQSEKGLFVGMPSKPDKSSNTGYRDTAKPITAEFRTALTGAVVTAYHAAIEKLQNRAAAVEAPAAEKPSIKAQLEAGAKQAAKGASEKPAPAKSKKAAKEDR